MLNVGADEGEGRVRRRPGAHAYRGLPQAVGVAAMGTHKMWMRKLHLWNYMVNASFIAIREIGA
jgi:hypothetical protein